MRPLNVHLIAAARPNFMKVAPLYHALVEQDWVRPVLVHTGQHYDANMSDTFFRDLGMPKPDYHLDVGSGTHAQQTGGVMTAYEPVVVESKPEWIIVVGDVNSTAACAIVGAKAGVPVVHLEAGLRSGDRRMPEEINRLVTDAICDVYWTPSQDANEHLIREGVAPDKIDFVGNIMIDSYESKRREIDSSPVRARLGVEGVDYVVVTLHRPSNVDEKGALESLVGQLVEASRRFALAFVVHPRTRARLQQFGLSEILAAAPGIRVCDPLGYVEFMGLVSRAKAIVTDSGGVQEESTYLGIPCLTLRENTERPVTVSIGTNRLVKPDELASQLAVVASGHWPKGARPPLWDGKAATRCAEALYVRSRARGLL